MRRENDAGFTMAELLVTLVILGVLAAVVIMSTGKRSTNAPQSCEANFQAVRTASEAYYGFNDNKYAASISQLRSERHLRSDPPVVPSSSPITAAVAPEGYALALNPVDGQPVVHVWGSDRTWGTSDDSSGGRAKCTTVSSGL